MDIKYAAPGMVLAQDITDEAGTLLLEQGITLTASYLRRLRQLGIHDIAIHDSEAAALQAQHAIPPELRTELSLCFQALYRLQTSRLTSSKLTTLYFRQIDKVLNQVVHETASQMLGIVNTQIRQPTADDMAHAVNVCLLSVITGLYLKWPRQMLQQLALGALLHDIGKSILIDAQQLSSHKLHPLYGRDILLRNRQDPLIARIAAEHHEWFDGSGYPLGLSAKEIHPLSQLVAIANFFDATMHRAERSGTPRQEVLEIMLACGNKQFDLTLLKAFIHTVPLYPVGTLVRLNTDQTAYVVRNRPHYPLRPCIRLRDTDMPEEIDLVCKPTLTIVEVIAN